MPVHEVQRFRCKDCQDTGVLAVRGLSTLNPLNERPPMDDTDRRTGFDPRLAFQNEARLSVVNIPCTFCPPTPRPVYRRDWERP